VQQNWSAQYFIDCWYKAKNRYPTLIEGGLLGARYAVSTYGWFEMSLLEDWFVSIDLPYFRKKVGKKAVIGHSLASHISMKVVKLCLENGIEFILLPPNSTHICQPVVVGFFKSLKAAWRKALSE